MLNARLCLQYLTVTVADRNDNFTNYRRHLSCSLELICNIIFNVSLPRLSFLLLSPSRDVDLVY